MPAAWRHGNPVFTGNITGVTNGDNITATYSCSATTSQPSGNVSHRAEPGGPERPSDQLHTNLVNGTLTVTNYPEAYTFITIAGMPQVAGTNDGTGSAARFNYPDGMAVDSAGNVYVADTDNNTIRKVTPAGDEGGDDAGRTGGQLLAPRTGRGAPRGFIILSAWRWTARATSMWRTQTTTRSGK